jgi:hypothetical protein
VPEVAAKDHLARAGQRHFNDATYLQADGRLPNADYHYGFAVECALKSLLLRYTGTTVSQQNLGGPPRKKPWIQDEDGKRKDFGHLPELWSDVEALLHGRSGSSLSSLLTASAPFSTWSVHDRYSDGAAIAEIDVRRHRAATERILRLHQQALIAGVLP